MDLRQLLIVWLDWGVFAGFLVSLIAAGWVFYDSQQKDIDATAWKVLVVVTTILIVPSLLFRLAPEVTRSLVNAVEPLSYLGILASVVAVIGLIAYVVYSSKQPSMRYEMGPATQSPTSSGQFGMATPLATAPAPTPATPGPTRPLDEPPTRGENEVVGRMPRSAETTILNRKPPALAWLVYRSGPRTGKTADLSEATEIGRDPMDNQIILEDTSVTRRHAKVKLENGQFFLYDLASANGTFVKDRASGEWKKLDSKWPLVDGDVVKFGEALMSFMQIKDQQT